MKPKVEGKTWARRERAIMAAIPSFFGFISAPNKSVAAASKRKSGAGGEDPDKGTQCGDVRDSGGRAMPPAVQPPLSHGPKLGQRATHSPE